MFLVFLDANVSIVMKWTIRSSKNDFRRGNLRKSEFGVQINFTKNLRKSICFQVFLVANVSIVINWTIWSSKKRFSIR